MVKFTPLAALLVLSCVEPARAQSFSYQCSSGGGNWTAVIDVQTKSARFTSPGGSEGSSRVLITEDVISFFDSSANPNWNGIINRYSGAYKDTDGDTGKCKRQ